jgi:hypothetical protein
MATGERVVVAIKNLGDPVGFMTPRRRTLYADSYRPIHLPDDSIVVSQTIPDGDSLMSKCELNKQQPGSEVINCRAERPSDSESESESCPNASYCYSFPDLD